MRIRFSLLVVILFVILYPQKKNLYALEDFNKTSISKEKKQVKDLQKALKQIKKTITYGQVDSAGILLKNFENRHQHKISSVKEINAEYLSTLATLFYEKGQLNDALSKYKSAFKIYKSLSQNKKIPELLEIRNDIGRVLIALNRLDDAKRLYNETLDDLKTYVPSEIDSAELSVLYNQMGVSEFYEGNLDKAYEYYDMSRTISTMSEGKNSINSARAYYNMGLIKEEKGFYIDAGVLYNKALEIYQKKLGKSHHHIAEVYGSLGSIYLKRYELVKAEYYFEKDLETSIRLYGDNHIETAWGYEDLGRVYKLEGKDSLAKAVLEKALKIRKNTYDEQHIYISNILLELAGLSKQIDSSILLAREAMQMQNKITLNANIGKWEISLFLLEKYIQLKRYPEAQQELKRAILLGKKYAGDKPHYMFAQTYILGSKLAWTQNNFALTDFYIQEALNACLKQKLTKEERYYIKPSQILFIPEYLEVIAYKSQLIYEYGMRANRLDLIKGSTDELMNIVAIINFHQKRRTSDDIDKKYDEIYIRIFKAGLKSCVAVWQQTDDKSYFDKAFEFAERIKYENTLKLLHGMDGYKMSNLPLTTVRKEYQLKKDILYNQSLLLKTKEKDRNEINLKLFNLYHEEERFYKNLKKIHPDYYNKKYDFQPIKPDEARNKLKSSKSVICQFVNIGNKKYLFLIAQNFTNILIQDEIDFTQLLSDLEKRGLKKLIVIPDYSSKWMNIEAVKYKNKYAIENFDFIYNTSVQNYFYRLDDKLINKKILTFAPIHFLSFGKEELLQSEKEVKGIQNFFKTINYIGKNANKENFIKNISQYGAIHISTHIDYDSVNPLESKLYLSPGENDNGILYAHDIFGFPMRTQLVTLSACDAKGNPTSAIKIGGIADAFMYNGCKNIIMTLWNVEDKVMKEIMVSFYKYLSMGYSKEKALKSAKIDYLKNGDKYKTDPKYWSGIILQGNSENLNLTPSFWQKNIKVVTTLLVLSALWLVRRRFSI
ncbi:MAG: CHAT domain-containing protein [Chitinophagales bacterium]|nr:CHAT domain-containing protein [Chitinophagales bacterium]